ncbi:hypothetical protein NQ314_019480 [Rhamnusium bicolor]|uniref:DDE-1 domain-containing protein n=1 Tax=Rhamnusium bicolor TaxID=1586634 RepID=A0AAV8WMS5_9CUCU|nr:hypothetical protein NQ314_019480 [Rhamnusium bicolor]
MVIYPYKRIPSNIVNSVPSGWGIGTSDNGWMKRELFYEYISNVFHPYVLNKKIQFPVILFVDGHKTHLTYELSKLCTSLKIILIALYPNATRFLQPADVSCFRPLKGAWKKAVLHWRRTNPLVQLTKLHFAPILKEALQQLKSETIINGFKACGLHPWNSNALDYTKCLGKQNKVEEVLDVPDEEFYKMTYENFTDIIGPEKVKQIEREIEHGNLDNLIEDFKLLLKIFKKFNGANEFETNSKYDVFEGNESPIRITNISLSDDEQLNINPCFTEEELNNMEVIIDEQNTPPTINAVGLDTICLNNNSEISYNAEDNNQSSGEKENIPTSSTRALMANKENNLVGKKIFEKKENDKLEKEKEKQEKAKKREENKAKRDSDAATRKAKKEETVKKNVAKVKTSQTITKKPSETKCLELKKERRFRFYCPNCHDTVAELDTVAKINKKLLEENSKLKETISHTSSFDIAKKIEDFELRKESTNINGTPGKSKLKLNVPVLSNSDKNLKFNVHSYKAALTNNISTTSSTNMQEPTINKTINNIVSPPNIMNKEVAEISVKDGEFREVRRRRKKWKVGNGDGYSMFHGREDNNKKIWLFITRVPDAISVVNIKLYIESHTNTKDIYVKKLSIVNAGNDNQSFMVGVDLNCKIEFMLQVSGLKKCYMIVLTLKRANVSLIIRIKKSAQIHSLILF